MCKLHGYRAALLLVLPLLLVAACKPETSIADYPCPKEGTKLTYANFGESYLAQNCQVCHGQASDARKGAPSGFDFGTIEQVRDHKDRIFARAAADNVTMPPGPDDPPADQRYQLAEWLACGAP
jgi:uncharacterized membrane protein